MKFAFIYMYIYICVCVCVCVCVDSFPHFFLFVEWFSVYFISGDDLRMLSFVEALQEIQYPFL